MNFRQAYSKCKTAESLKARALNTYHSCVSWFCFFVGWTVGLLSFYALHRWYFPWWMLLITIGGAWYFGVLTVLYRKRLKEASSKEFEALVLVDELLVLVDLKGEK